MYKRALLLVLIVVFLCSSINSIALAEATGQAVSAAPETAQDAVPAENTKEEPTEPEPTEESLPAAEETSPKPQAVLSLNATSLTLFGGDYFVLIPTTVPNTLREQVVFLAEQHMTILEPDRQVLLKWVGKHGKDNIRRLLELQQADFLAKGTGETTDYFQKMLELLDSLMEEEPCLTARDLKINGRDILALGVDPGPLVGECMRFLLERVQQNAVENTREALLAEVETFLHSLCTDPELFNSIIEEDAT